ncbi:MAG: hypothetical protein K2H01_10430 [Ruminococcus sp.]|nr:hypothetical protein [Ruminococcus sp.]
MEADDKNDKIPYKQDFHHHFKRRKRGHNYLAAGKYHITINKSSVAPDFCTLKIIELKPEGVSVNLSPLGEIIDKEILDFSSHHPQIRVHEYIVMPDHFHMLIEVEKRLDKHVGYSIGGLMTGISNIWRKHIGNMDSEVFEKGYYDKPIYSFRDTEPVSDYIRQNPYRLAVRKMRPDFFRKTRNLFIDGREIQAYGNLFFLRNPFKYPLIVHRADSDECFQQKVEDCLAFVKNGGVIVSPFISKREKEIQGLIENSGGRIILIKERPLADREKPTKHDFDLCCKGQLLIISPIDYLNIPKALHPSRSQCLDMNKLAEKICEHSNS